MAIGDEGRDLLLMLLLLIPLEFIMTSRRVVKDGNRKKAVALAGGLLALAASAKLGLELSHKPPSYYDMLGVLPGASSDKIRKGYREAARVFHPDKMRKSVEDEEAENDAFVKLKAVYDVLSDSALRDLYNKFGEQGLENKNDTNQLLASLGFFYVVWLAVAYLLTRSKQVGRAQTWTFTGLLALGIFEYQACILSFDFLEEAVPQLAMFEKIDFMHRLYPVYLLSARMVAWLFYEDTDAQNCIGLQILHAKTDQLLLMLRQVQIEMLDGVKAEGTAGKLTEDLVPGTGVKLANLDNLPAQYRPLHPATLGARPPTGAKAGNAQKQAGGGKGMGSIVWFFGVYFFFQWLLGRSS